MSITAPDHRSPAERAEDRPLGRPSLLEFTADTSIGARSRLAWRDLRDGLGMWRLGVSLGWLDIRLRYRGSLLGPFWLTMSTAVMVAALGFLYAKLFAMNLQEYLPFLTLSLVLWNFLAAVVGDACLCFTQAESVIRTIRMPYVLHAIRSVVRNVLVLAHNIVVIAAVFAIFHIWPGRAGLLVLPALGVWAIDAVAITLLLGAICARFRDIPPIVGSVMQIAFFVSAIIWKPDQIPNQAALLPLNPFFALVEIVRAPLLGEAPSALTWLSAVVYSVLLCLVSAALFVRVRGRLAFWV